MPHHVLMNGLRHRSSAVLIGLILAVLVVAAIPAADVISEWLYHPLGTYPSPQEVVIDAWDHVGEHGLQVKAGGTLPVKATKCVTADHEVPVISHSEWVRLSPTTAVIPRTSNVSSNRQPGCMTRTFPNEIPATLPPGVYQLNGGECTQEEARPQVCRVWYTSTFEVVE